MFSQDTHEKFIIKDDLKSEEKLVKTSRNTFPERVSTHSTVCIAEAWNQVLQYNEWMMPSYVAHFTPKAAATVNILGQ